MKQALTGQKARNKKKGRNAGLGQREYGHRHEMKYSI
jgi:hypothetical protein